MLWSISWRATTSRLPAVLVTAARATVYSFVFLMGSNAWSGEAVTRTLYQPKKQRGGDYVRALLEGHLANAKAFRTLHCWYEITKGKAESVEAAREGKFPKSHVGRVEWIIKDEKELFRFIGEDQAVAKEVHQNIKKKAEGKVYGSKEHTWFYLSNGPDKMRYTPLLRNASIYPENSPASTPVYQIPYTNSMGPRGGEINIVKEMLPLVDQGTATYAGRRNHRGSQADSIDFTSKYGKGSLYFDPARGFALLRMFSQQPTSSMEVLATDFRRCDNSAWFPMRTLVISKQKPGVSVKEYLVSKISTADVSDEKFVIHLPEKTGVWDPRDVKTTFVIREPMTIGLNDIAKLAKMGKRARVEAIDREETARGNAATSGFWWLWLVGALLVVLCFFGLWRRRSVRRAGA